MSLLPDDTTKPSRLHRRRKKKWRVQSLTAIPPAVMIRSHSQKTSVGIETPHIGHQRPLSNVVFLCSPKTQAALCRLVSVMASCIGQLRKGLAGSYAGSLNPIQPATQRLRPKGGGLFLSIGATAMQNNTQKPIASGKFTPKQAHFDLFKYAGCVKTLICRDLSSVQAASLLPELSGVYRLHFTGMMEG
ncbi:hypothetical protein [Methylomicrobium sp. Wu6]|uniref:hypothetical protein n=1 Tax=Methylomicrobium sp. Wu6 TaxID=3107928 RepID=UPI002DD620C9|nr:hypothetical protein [Methylomicrobium sp. Wu6]MEC4747409.1 hypothetical protein [Methylomicrobium sp. Wu6]